MKKIDYTTLAQLLGHRKAPYDIKKSDYEALPENITFYHGTTLETWRKIQVKGLVRVGDQGNLTDNPKLAWHYARVAASQEKSEPVLLKITLPKHYLLGEENAISDVVGGEPIIASRLDNFAPRVYKYQKYGVAYEVAIDKVPLKHIQRVKTKGKETLKYLQVEGKLEAGAVETIKLQAKTKARLIKLGGASSPDETIRTLLEQSNRLGDDSKVRKIQLLKYWIQAIAENYDQGELDRGHVECDHEALRAYEGLEEWLKELAGDAGRKWLKRVGVA